MITRIIVAAGLAAGLMVSAANAVTVVNADKTAHEITLQPKSGHLHHYMLAGHRHRTLECKGGGVITLGKDSQACDAKTAKVFIKSGKFTM